MSGVTAKSIVCISSSFLHEMDGKKESSGGLPFFTENQAHLTTPPCEPCGRALRERKREGEVKLAFSVAIGW